MPWAILKLWVGLRVPLEIRGTPLKVAGETQYLQAYLSPSRMVSTLLFHACTLVNPLLAALCLETWDSPSSTSSLLNVKKILLLWKLIISLNFDIVYSYSNSKYCVILWKEINVWKHVSKQFKIISFLLNIYLFVNFVNDLVIYCFLLNFASYELYNNNVVIHIYVELLFIIFYIIFSL